MRLLSPRLPASVAIASIICLLPIFAVNAAVNDDIILPNADPEAAVSDQDFEVQWKQKGHHHHSQKKNPDKTESKL
jgi:hypothetical protein